MTMSSCPRRTLASGEYAMVEHCACGAIHVTIGPVTLRLSTASLAPIASTLTDAAIGLALDAAPTAGVLPGGLPGTMPRGVH